MTQKRIVAVVVGTRPEAIKMAPVVEALRRSVSLGPMLISSGQHREMLAEALDAFGLEADVELAVMQPQQTLAGLTARALMALDSAFEAHAPAAVLVHGDTTTTLAATLAAFYRNIPVGHVEAGLRTGDLLRPFPEEANRVLADRLARWHFAPTEVAAAALRAEGLEGRIWVTGNTVVDALRLVSDRLPEAQPEGLPLLRDRRGAVLVTCHRRESFGEGLASVCRALSRLAAEYPEVDWVFPVHLNPRVRGPVHEALADHPNVHLLPPLGYVPFVWLMTRAALVLTDSGGLQEECAALGKPVLVMREKTERPEAVRAGVARLVGTSEERIVNEVTALLSNEADRAAMAAAPNPYGDGRAAERVVRVLEEALAARGECQ